MILNIAFVLCVLILALCTSVIVAIGVSGLIFWGDAHYLQLDLVVNLSQKQIWHNYQQIMAYLTRPWLPRLQLANFSSSAAGLEHFQEVRQLFILTAVMWLLSLCLLYWWQKRQALPALLQINQKSLGKINLIIIIIALLASMNFDTLFVIFHKILFRNNNWLFDPNKDPVINILPDTFFAHCFLVAFIVFEGLLLLFWLYGRQKQKHIANNNK
ncbi:TIGR01906 family membrane protein [Bombilactobacillus bombi]|uniref:TIGR01906 family membrane protein n=1 Tax=Bombilactobacillus bombi TaxID=1303590 RepID=UPI0015E60833|nr:TIGR01906 family membrane protein [Bombilactobacillus bombi]MBA1435018.1 TIGR01906 family membrane protein [Bombilactobacillus bombi]